MFITEEQALRRLPELRELVTLRQANWTFRLIGDRDTGLQGVVASYNRQRYTDALWIYDARTIMDKDVRPLST
jgi:hypothetical protein